VLLGAIAVSKRQGAGIAGSAGDRNGSTPAEPAAAAAPTSR